MKPPTISPAPASAKQRDLNFWVVSAETSIFSLDLGKIIAGALTGIGFLGAGAIIKREGDQIVGTATGASIWAAGGLGLTIGFGAYGLAIMGFITIYLILLVGGYFMPQVNGQTDKEKKPR